MTELIGVVIGGLLAIFASYISNMLQVKKESLEKKKNILETLYIDMRKWYNNAFSVYQDFSLVIDGECDWSQYLDKIISMKKNDGAIISKIRINLYFPELTDVYEKIVKAVQGIYKYIEDDIKRAYSSGRDLSKYKTPFFEKINNANKAYEEFENKVIILSRKLK